MAWRKPHRSSKPKPASREHRPRPRPAGDTSWEKSAGWYDKIIGAQGSELYQRVVIPGALKLLGPPRGERVLDLGCGQGVFSRALADSGCDVTGVDAAPSLIERAKTYPSRVPIRYFAKDAADIHELGPFGSVTAILSLQNMSHPGDVCRACAAELSPGGRMLWVLNHPCFRIPKQTSWGWDDENGIQYRRIDGYASSKRIPILMHPGEPDSETTMSFHRSLAALMSFAFRTGFVLAGFEEWCSDKISEPGARAEAENHARREFPLFAAMLWRKQAATAGGNISD